MRREDLSFDEASDFFRLLISQEANPAQVAAAFTALTAKGETAEELAGMARVMRSEGIRVQAMQKNAVDIAGTGSSVAKTFNISTGSAFVAAGAGLTIAKQTNRGVMSKTGSAEVLKALGVKAAIAPPVAQASLNGTGLCFISPAKFHPALARAGEIRRLLGIRTCLNMLSLMANPAAVSRQVVGVWHASLLEPMARAFALLKPDKVWIVRGDDGLDEITATGKTSIAEIAGGDIRILSLTPPDFGLKSGSIDHLRTDSSKESAKIILDVLASRRRDEARSLIVLNAAAALVVGGLATDPMQAARLAEQSIDSGQAQNKLDRLIQITNKK